MTDVDLEVVHSDGEVECFLDNEVFFGPVTEREKEIRKPLPRKTLHPCEIAEISKRGMTFHEWEDFKDQIHRNEMNDKAIIEVYGLDADTTEESFTSCCTSAGDGTKQVLGEVVNLEHPCVDSLSESVTTQHDVESLSELSIDQPDEETQSESSAIGISQNDISVTGELNDTWEIQERMLLLAEKLERGEDIPELGICRHSSGVVEYTTRVNKSDKKDTSHSAVKEKDNSTVKAPLTNHQSQAVRENEEENYERFKKEDQIIEDVVNKRDNPKVEMSLPTANSSGIKITVSAIEERKTKSVEALANEMDCLFLADSVLETSRKNTPLKVNNCWSPSRMPPPSPAQNNLETPMKTPSGFGVKHRSTPIQNGSVTKSATKPNARSNKNTLVASSPVGMYIRSLPEPILIENVRSAQKKKQIHSMPMVKPVPVAVKNKDGRWSVARTPRSSAVSSKENHVDEDDFANFKPVLPCVLHEAAATLIEETPIPSPHTMPGAGGKIGKLMERGPTPTVMKHHGRIKIPRNTANSAKIIHSPMSARCVEQSSSLMEVSILESVGTKSYTPNRNPASCRK